MFSPREKRDLNAILFGISPLQRPCPFCKAKKDEPCVTNFGKLRQPHAVRVSPVEAQTHEDF